MIIFKRDYSPLLPVFILLILPVNAEPPPAPALAPTPLCNPSDDALPYIYFSTKTSYEAIRPLQINTSEKSEGCAPLHIWALIRHGTRYPNKKTIKKLKSLMQIKQQILDNHKEGRGSLCEKDLKNLEKWNFTISENVSNQITEQGKRELIFTANRLSKTFNTLLKKKTKNEFTFQCSNVSRAIDSAVTFSNELLNTNYSNTRGNSISVNETFLHLTDHCPKYAAEVYSKAVTYKEGESLLKSPVGQQLLADVSKRLGFQQTLSHDVISAMYLSCAYENAWSIINVKPAFCVGFTQENLKLLEYKIDLDQYYRLGYGSTLATKLGCPQVKDMIARLNAAASVRPQSNEEEKAATFNFAHSETLLPFLTALELNRDEDVFTAENYHHMRDNRRWRLSLTDAFASNIFAVLYNCSSVKEPTTFGVVLYQNERIIHFPGCESDFCPLQYVNEKYRLITEEKECGVNCCQSSNSYGPQLGSSTVLVCFNVLFVFILSLLVIIRE